jgi:cytoskeleton protein RodZ
MNKPVEVIVEALDAVEVEITTKDGKSEKISLTAEQIHTFKSKNGLKLNISNGGAVNVIVNGKDLGIPGNLGKPVKLNY